MANVRNGNTFYIDTQYSGASDELAIKGIRVAYIFIASSAGSNQLLLADSVTVNNKINIQNIVNTGNAGDSRLFDFNQNPILFPNGIRPIVVRACVATCMVINPTG